MPSNHDQDLLDQFKHLKESVYSDYIAKLLSVDTYYDLTFAKDIVPEEWKSTMQPLIPPTARQAVDEASDHILVAPKVKVPVRPVDNNHTTEQDVAERKRKFLASFWHRVFVEGDPLGRAKKLLIKDGKVCLKKTLRWDLIPEAPGKGASDKARRKYRNDLRKLGRLNFLWHVEALPNDTVFEDPDNPQDPRYVYVAYKISAITAREEWDEPDSVKGLLATDPVDYVEYWSRPKFNPDGTWDPGEYKIWINDELVHDEDNPYPYIPIAIDESGYGVVTSENNPNDRYVGLIDHTRGIFEAEAKQMTAWQAVTEMTAFPLVTTRNMADRRINVGPGVVVPLEGAPNDPDGESIDIIGFPDFPIGTVQLVDKTTQIANNTLKTGILGGVPQRGVDTATEADQNVRNASSKLSGPVGALERVVTKLNRWVLQDIELVLEAPVTIYGAADATEGEQQLKPNEIRGYYETHVTFGTTDQDAIQMTTARFWAEMHRVIPFLSVFTTMEKMGLEDPQAEMQRRAAENMFLSQEFNTIRTFTGAQSLGELATLLREVGLNGDGGGGGANSNESLLTVDELQQPAEAGILRDARESARVSQGPSELRGPSAY